MTVERSAFPSVLWLFAPGLPKPTGMILRSTTCHIILLKFSETLNISWETVDFHWSGVGSFPSKILRTKLPQSQSHDNIPRWWRHVYMLNHTSHVACNRGNRSVGRVYATSVSSEDSRDFRVYSFPPTSSPIRPLWMPPCSLRACKGISKSQWVMSTSPTFQNSGISQKWLIGAPMSMLNLSALGALGKTWK